MQSRRVPTENLDVLGQRDAEPHRHIGEFVESVQHNDYFIKAPVFSTNGDGLEEFYITARNEHQAMMREKAILMEHKEIQRKTNETHIHDLKQAQEELQERFIKVNIFLREFEEKRITAVKRGASQVSLHEDLRTEIKEIQAVNEMLKEFRDKLQATANEYEPYERVLNDVVNRLHAFNSVKDLMQRCDALMMAQVDIVELSEKLTLELEVMRKRLVDMSREAALQVLGLKNALSNVGRLYEAASNTVLKWERTLQTAKATINEGIISKDRVVEGINHLYRLLCQRRFVLADLPHEAIEQRLGFIKGEVELLRDILEIFQKRNLKTVASRSELLC